MPESDKTLWLVRSVALGASERKRRWIAEMLAAGAGVFAELTERYGPERLHASRPLEDLLTVIASQVALESDDVVRHKTEAHDEAARYIDEDEHIVFCNWALYGMRVAVERILERCGVALSTEIISRLAAQVDGVDELARAAQRDGTPFPVSPEAVLDRGWGRVDDRKPAGPATPDHGLVPRPAEPEPLDRGE